MASVKERRAAPRKGPSKSEAQQAPQPDPETSAKPASSKPISHEDLYNLIAQTAYFKAKARGFQPGGEVQDWIEAEAEVTIRLQAGRRR
jgi:hypothetical protein